MLSYCEIKQRFAIARRLLEEGKVAEADATVRMCLDFGATIHDVTSYFTDDERATLRKGQ